MKRFLKVVSVLCGLLLFASAAWSLTIDGGIEVGALDTWIVSGSTLSGDQYELDWVNTQVSAYLGSSVTYTPSDYYKHDYVPTLYNVYDGSDLQPDTYAFQLDYNPDFFLVKFGGGDGYSSHALWANNSLLNWGVIDLSIPAIDIKSITAYSHYAEIGQNTVPEPATLILFGTGLIGLAGLGRKRFKN